MSGIRRLFRRSTVATTEADPSTSHPRQTVPSVHHLAEPRTSSQLRGRNDLIQEAHRPLSEPSQYVQSEFPRFIYKKLPDPGNWIRLLKVRSHTPDCSTKISCSIEQKYIPGGHYDYTALSYTWEEPFNTPECADAYSRNFDVDVLVSENGKEASIRITRNLYEALQVWLRKTAYRDRWLWIDQICINQKDPKDMTEQEDRTEKGRQLAIMGKIYSTARETFAWIGLNDNDSAAVFDLYLALHPTVSQWERQYRKRLGPADVRIDARSAPKFPLESIHQAQVDSMKIRIEEVREGIERRLRVVLPSITVSKFYRFLRRCRYFSRLWMVQEHALAKKATLCIGERTLPREALYWLIEFGLFANLQEGFDHPDALATNESSGDQFGIIMSVTRSQQKGGLDEPLMRDYFLKQLHGAANDNAFLCYTYLQDILLRTTSLQCRHAKDNIYAIIGLVQVFARSQAIPNGMLLLPYETDTYTTFIATQWRMLLNSPLLGALALVQDQSQRVGCSLPSWVPLFGSYKGGLAPPLAYGRAVKSTKLFAASGCKWAEGHPSNHIFFTASKVQASGMRKLFLDGYLVDNIAACCDESPFLAFRGQRERNIHSFKEYVWLLQAWRALGPAYVMGQPMVHAITELLTYFYEYPVQERVRDFRALLMMNGFMAYTIDRQQGTSVGRHLIEVLTLPSSTSDFVQSGEVEAMKIFGETCDEMPIIEAEQEVYKLLHSHQETIQKPALNFTRRTMNTGAMRKLARTRDGYLCRVPNSVSAEQGDQIWILRPSRVACVLRPTSVQGEYIFMGEAYVQGIMFGELVEKRERLRQDVLHEVILV